MIGDRIMLHLYYNLETGVPYQVNDKIIFDSVLLIGTRNETIIGRPLIPGIKVVGIVDEITQLVKKRWIWKKQRHRKTRIHGSRNWVTVVRIVDIQCGSLKLYNDLINDNMDSNGNVLHQDTLEQHMDIKLNQSNMEDINNIDDSNQETINNDNDKDTINENNNDKYSDTENSDDDQ